MTTKMITISILYQIISTAPIMFSLFCCDKNDGIFVFSFWWNKKKKKKKTQREKKISEREKQIAQQQQQRILHTYTSNNNVKFDYEVDRIEQTENGIRRNIVRVYAPYVRFIPCHVVINASQKWFDTLPYLKRLQFTFLQWTIIEQSQSAADISSLLRLSPLLHHPIHPPIVIITHCHQLIQSATTILSVTNICFRDGPQVQFLLLPKAFLSLSLSASIFESQTASHPSLFNSDLQLQAFNQLLFVSPYCKYELFDSIL